MEKNNPINKNYKNHEKMLVPAKKLPIAPHPKDWRHSFHWRIFRIMAEFVDGFQFLSDFKKTVTLFGSATFNETNHWYKVARDLAQMLSQAGYSVVTGGGPGIMEAGNRGAVEGKNGDSIGLNIQLPYEQRTNRYVEKGHGFYYFFTRKVMMSFSAQAYVFFPGGYGTLDEAFELLVLIQTKKISGKIPVILVGQEFWCDMDSWLRKTLLKEYQTIDPEDLKIYTIVNTAKEAFDIIRKTKPREEFR
ncbi:MAG: TIGR00730 family Rossman fold protein [Candidatus Azambacteria bacterium]|nr:TIGR00730 family Rossman fold protein [Candidatus Azambacteria bacterium]